MLPATVPHSSLEKFEICRYMSALSAVLLKLRRFDKKASVLACSKPYRKREETRGVFCWENQNNLTDLAPCGTDLHGAQVMERDHGLVYQTFGVEQTRESDSYVLPANAKGISLVI